MKLCASHISPWQVELARIANTIWKLPSQILGFPELFARARQSVWGNLAAAPIFSADQRDLARSHMRILMNLATDKAAAPQMSALRLFRSCSR